MCIALSDFDLELVDRPGKESVVSDALSRNPVVGARRVDVYKDERQREAWAAAVDKQ